MKRNRCLSAAVGLFHCVCLCWLAGTSTAEQLEPHLQMNGPFASPVEVNEQCMGCHEKETEDLRKSVHWTWERERVIGNTKEISAKEMNLSRFGISAAANPAICRRCHISLQSETGLPEPGGSTAINCLVCHDTTGMYRLDISPSDLESIARKVGIPSTQNCRSCHDRQCGLTPEVTSTPAKDVHIQDLGFSCQHCHPSGHSHSMQRQPVSNTNGEMIRGCGACHTQTPHTLARLNQHAALIACQSCHIPSYGSNNAAVFSWNWLLANSMDRTFQENNLLFSRQGFTLGRNITPVYLWDDGSDVLYTRGTKIQPEKTTLLQSPGPRSPASKITPFTAQYATQLYDTKYRFLISPKLAESKAPFFNGTDWDAVIMAGMDKVRLPYSGQYGFTTTLSLYRLNHGVVPAAEALDCMDCHGKTTRFDWQRLGYSQDPWDSGSSRMNPPKSNEEMPTIDLPPIRESILPVTPTP